jgi:hypothetical protein
MPENYYLQVKLADHWYNYAFSDKMEIVCLELEKQVKLFHKNGKLCPSLRITYQDSIVLSLF